MRLAGNHIRSYTEQELIIDGANYFAAALIWSMALIMLALLVPFGWTICTHWHGHARENLALLSVLAPLFAIFISMPFSPKSLMRRVVRLSRVDNTVSITWYDALLIGGVLALMMFVRGRRQFERARTTSNIEKPL